MSSDVGGRSALVTGGGTGIGAATALRLARDGYAVTVTGRRAGPLEERVEEIVAAGGRALAVPADVTEPAEAERVVAAAVAAFGGIDVLVINHGTGGNGGGALTAEQPVEEWDNVLNVNLRSAFIMAKVTLPYLKERRGSIVTVASNSAVMAGPGWGPYCTSKAGLIMLTKSLANDYGRFGVRANAVCPGFIVTDMADGAMEAIAKAWNTDVPGAYKLANRDIPLQRAGVVDEIAGAIAFLAGPDASYITGAALPIDGGATIVDITATEAIFAGPR